MSCFAPRRIEVIGATHMLSRGATADLILLTDGIRDQLEGWRTEVSAPMNPLQAKCVFRPSARAPWRNAGQGFRYARRIDEIWARW
jgi:hypothetical protein